MCETSVHAIGAERDAGLVWIPGGSGVQLRALADEVRNPCEVDIFGLEWIDHMGVHARHDEVRRTELHGDGAVGLSTASLAFLECISQQLMEVCSPPAETRDERVGPAWHEASDDLQEHPVLVPRERRPGGTDDAQVPDPRGDNALLVFTDFRVNAFRV